MKRGVLVWSMLLSVPTGAAAEVVIYRCTDTQGALTVQNMPCPKGMQQTRKIMQSPQTAQRPLQMPAAPVVPLLAVPGDAAATATAPARSTLAETAAPAMPAQPLPPLFHCQRREGDRYFSEDAEPPGRCLPLRVTGLDGNPATGAGEACEVVRDRCTAVAAEQSCSTWKQRVEEARSQWRFAPAENATQRQQEFERLRRLFDASGCPNSAGPN